MRLRSRLRSSKTTLVLAFLALAISAASAFINIDMRDRVANLEKREILQLGGYNLLERLYDEVLHWKRQVMVGFRAEPGPPAPRVINANLDWPKAAVEHWSIVAPDGKKILAPENYGPFRPAPKLPPDMLVRMPAGQAGHTDPQNQNLGSFRHYEYKEIRRILDGIDK